MIKSIHHVQITIPKGNEAQARTFYCDILGLTEIEKPASLQGRGGFWLQIGTQEIHIGMESGIDRSATKAHIAYQVTDLSQWRNHLEKSGITIAESIPIPGYDRCEFRDPFGNRLEMIQALSEKNDS